MRSTTSRSACINTHSWLKEIFKTTKSMTSAFPKLQKMRRSFLMSTSFSNFARNKCFTKQSFAFSTFLISKGKEKCIEPFTSRKLKRPYCKLPFRLKPRGTLLKLSTSMTTTQLNKSKFKISIKTTLLPRFSPKKSLIFSLISSLSITTRNYINTIKTRSGLAQLAKMSNLK